MRNPYKAIMNNVKLSAKYGAAGGRTKTLLQEAGFTEEEIVERISNNYSGNKTITIDENYLRKLFSEQDERCYWLGTKINLDDIFISHHPMAPSIDRLRNLEGYEPGNVVITTRFANRGRCNISDEFFLNDCLPRIIDDIKFVRKELESYNIDNTRRTIEKFYT